MTSAEKYAQDCSLKEASTDGYLFIGPSDHSRYWWEQVPRDRNPNPQTHNGQMVIMECVNQFSLLGQYPTITPWVDPGNAGGHLTWYQGGRLSSSSVPLSNPSLPSNRVIAEDQKFRRAQPSNLDKGTAVGMVFYANG